MESLDLGLLVLRIGFGASMFAHGWNKIHSGIAGTAGWFTSIGFRWPRVQARTASFSEMAAGMLLVTGLLTPLACAVFIALMTVAIVTVHARVGYFIFLPNGGWEYCASIIVASAALSLTGPGELSLDSAWSLPAGPPLLAVPVGLVLALCHLSLSYRPVRPSASS